MPPRKLTEEQKQQAFENWQASDEYTKLSQLSNVSSTLLPFDQGTEDISDNWAPFLQELFETGTQLKVPGRKAKCKVALSLLVTNSLQCMSRSISGPCFSQRLISSLWTVSALTSLIMPKQKHGAVGQHYTSCNSTSVRAHLRCPSILSHISHGKRT